MYLPHKASAVLGGPRKRGWLGRSQEPTLKTLGAFHLEDEKRIWSLRLNLDDFNSEYLKLRNDGDRFAFFLGFHCGCMNGDLNESDSKPFESGYGIGSSMHAKALALSQVNAGSAKSSVATRRQKYGTAQPSKRTPSERSSERSGNARANAERSPERLSSLTIEPSNDLTREPETKKRKNGYSSEVLAIYEAYPRKDGPGSCSKQIIAALEIEPFDSLLEATQAFCIAVRKWDQEDQDQYTPMASTWFSQQRWLADRKTWERKSKTKTLKNGVKHDGFATTDYLAGLDGLPTF